MVDAAIVMIENMHRHLEREENQGRDRWEVAVESARDVGPALFFSLLIITLSFLHVFALQAQEGRLFRPLAFTTAFAMAAAALLSITVVPVLMGLFIRGRIPEEDRNPLNRWMKAAYMPVLNEGSVMDMPSLLPGMGTGMAKEVLQNRDSVPCTNPSPRSGSGRRGGKR